MVIHGGLGKMIQGISKNRMKQTTHGVGISTVYKWDEMGPRRQMRQEGYNETETEDQRPETGTLKG